MAQLSKKLKVFLCHASDDKEFVQTLYYRLANDGLDVWLDTEKLLPGQKWEQEIPKAVKDADAVIVCISKTSVTKEGYVQKEIKFALDFANEKPEDTIYLIPAKLENCEMPTPLKGWQWVDLSSDRASLDEAEYTKLLKSLSVRAENVGAIPPSTSFGKKQYPNYEGETKVVDHRFADLILNLVTRQVTRGDRPISLSKTEFQLLQLFMENPRQVLNQKFILERVWGNSIQNESNIVEVYIRYLREKLEAEGEARIIHTVRGWGYVLREHK